MFYWLQLQSLFSCSSLHSSPLASQRTRKWSLVKFSFWLLNDLCCPPPCLHQRGEGVSCMYVTFCACWQSNYFIIDQTKWNQCFFVFFFKDKCQNPSPKDAAYVWVESAIPHITSIFPLPTLLFIKHQTPCFFFLIILFIFLNNKSEVIPSYKACSLIECLQEEPF